MLLKENEFPDDKCQIQGVGVIDLLWFSKQLSVLTIKKLIYGALNLLLEYFSASVVLMNILIPSKYVHTYSTLTWLTVL